MPTITSLSVKELFLFPAFTIALFLSTFTPKGELLKSEKHATSLENEGSHFCIFFRHFDHQNSCDRRVLKKFENFSSYLKSK